MLSVTIGSRSRCFLTAAAGFVLSGWIGMLPAAAEGGKQHIGDPGEESAVTYYTFPGVPRLAISRDGNLVRLEGPTGYEHIGNGEFSEGYVLCYGTTRVFDLGDDESGFGPSTVGCSGRTCTVTRNTLDGKLQLKQVITKTADPERSLNVEMTITNKTGSSLTGVVLRRQVDFDVDTGGPLGTGDFTNWFGASERESAFAWNASNDHASEDHALVLRYYNKLPEAARRLAKVTSAILDDSCNPVNIAANGPVQGDYGVTLQYNVGTLTAGKATVLSAQYQRN